MADQQNSGAMFGFDDSNQGLDSSYMAEANNSHQSSHSNRSHQSNDPADTGEAADRPSFIYDSPNWAYPGDPSFDFNFAPASTGTSSDPLFQTADWDMPSSDQQQQQPHGQQQSPPLLNTATSAYGQQPGASVQPGQLQQQHQPQFSAPQDPSNSAQQQQQQRPNVPGGIATLNLTPAQQEKLRSIAMPAHLQYQSPKSEASPLSAGGAGALSSPDTAGGSKALMNRKRKSSADVDEDEEDEDGQPIKKTAHNMIEKRYRTNLNDKIAALRDSVPSLRIMSKTARGEDTTEDREELHGLTPAHKLNKATVLSKATEYIRHLEKRNNRLLDENSAMQARIAAFEKLFMAGAMSGTMSPMQQPPTPMQYPQDQYISTSTGTPAREGQQPQGMIQVPDDMKRILSAQMSNQPYPVPQQNYRSNPALLRQQQIQQQQQQIQQGGRWGNAGPYFGKLMVGSLAGLMVVEAFREEEQSNESPEGRGLFAVPVQFLRHLSTTSHIHLAGHAVSVSRLLFHFKILLFFGLFLWVFVPSLFTSSKKPKEGQEQVRNSLQAAPSLASPIHVRRQAWLTAIQTVWVPQHNFFLEAAALIMKTMKLSLRNMIGTHGFQMLTGLTEDQETARVKAWTIALDAQLAGGDVEINKSRLTLTLLASGTLPDTPLRLMLKALHIRVLLWDLGSNGLHNVVAAKLARSCWNEAKQLNRVLTQLRRSSNEPHDDALPEHLTVLLDHECDDILNNNVIERAYNLAWNLSTTENVSRNTDGMDLVVDDQAVRSPMDAVAAWWSCQQVQEALETSLLSNKDVAEVQDNIATHINNAVTAAPIASSAQARALVARAVLVNSKRGASIAAAMPEVQLNDAVDGQAADKSMSVFDSTSAGSQAPDLQIALRCAMAMAHLQKGKSSTLPSEATKLVEKVASPEVTANLSPLGCASLFNLMAQIHSDVDATETCSTSLERLAGSLRIWIGSAPGEKSGFSQDVRHIMVDRCLSISKSVVGMETDTGYGSMSECEDEAGC